MTFTHPSAIDIDSAAMRQAGRDALSLALMDARNHSLYLFAALESGLSGASVTGRPVATLLRPLLWQIGYMGWFQEYWVARQLQRSASQGPGEAAARLPSVLPQADLCWLNSADPMAAPLPSASEIRTYLLQTLEATLELLEQTPSSDAALYGYRLCLFREDQCGEALIAWAQSQGLALDLPLGSVSGPRAPIALPGQRWRLGSGPEGFAFDNERAAHELWVPEFEIDAQVVTWAQLVEFVDDGGYDRPELWHPDGWSWLNRCQRRAPRYVEQLGVASGAVLQTRFGSPRRMAAAQAVTHVSWWEADAWARWAGRRLPSEAEWELAAETAQRRGFRWGEVWEWTASRFLPYPGFVPGPWGDYSQPHFGSHRVLRGASFATRSRLQTPRYRYFLPPQEDSAFAGFRTCAI